MIQLFPSFPFVLPVCAEVQPDEAYLDGTFCSSDFTLVSQQGPDTGLSASRTGSTAGTRLSAQYVRTFGLFPPPLSSGSLFQASRRFLWTYKRLGFFMAGRVGGVFSDPDGSCVLADLRSRFITGLLWHNEAAHGRNGLNPNFRTKKSTFYSDKTVISIKNNRGDF